ncbi:OsmC family protein [Salinispira pacifica]
MGYITRAELKEGMAFDVELHGHKFTVDAEEQFGGKDYGPRPKALMLSALAGCTGMDVVSIVNKMKMPYDSFSLEVEADQSDEHPKVYTRVKIRYIFSGSQLDRDKIERAVELSLEKYCGVANMLKHTAKIEYEIITN